jgi:hypothetical protein
MPYEKLIQTYEGTYKDRFGNEYELEGGTYYKLYPGTRKRTGEVYRDC